MITANLEYYRPATLKEASSLFADLEDRGKNPVYYSGGTEIITRLRERSLETGAIVDLKDVPECTTLKMTEEKLTVGSAVTLNEIADSGFFPLLAHICCRFLDHTNRNKVTVGGNMCSSLPYKECILPFLVTDAVVTLTTGEQKGTRTLPLSKVFDKGLALSPGEILVQIHVKKEDLGLPWAYDRVTRQERIAYPLASVAAVKKNGSVRAAVTGVCDYPFTLSSLGTLELPSKPRSDIDGSGEYRTVVAKKLLAQVGRTLGVN